MEGNNNNLNSWIGVIGKDGNWMMAHIQTLKKNVFTRPTVGLDTSAACAGQAIGANFTGNGVVSWEVIKVTYDSQISAQSVTSPGEGYPANQIENDVFTRPTDSNSYFVTYRIRSRSSNGAQSLPFNAVIELYPAAQAAGGFFVIANTSNFASSDLSAQNGNPSASAWQWSLNTPLPPGITADVTSGNTNIVGIQFANTTGNFTQIQATYSYTSSQGCSSNVAGFTVVVRP